MNQILIIDDDIPVGNMLEEVLGREGYKVLRAYSGTEALLLLSAGQPDLVLLDYNMPVCDGAQVLQMIRSETEFADIPVFFLTGRVDKASVSRVLPLKPDGYLVKYLKPAQIKQKIDAYFDNK